MASSKTDSAAEVASFLRQIPAVDELLGREALRVLEKRVGRRLLVEATRKTIQSLRTRISGGALFEISVEALEREIIAAAESSAEFSLRPVINASGVILHTNLGRAPLAAKAVEHLMETAGVYSNLEYNLELGERGKRDEHTDRLFARLLGAEMTLVVNNNAAAVFLALNTLAQGGEVIVSRGELIEIGGAFRIPEICSKSGALLREVGTTNRTRLSDYAAAINDRTRALLRVHPSNFRMVGFTERPELGEVVDLAHQHHLPLVEDLGSGSLVDLTSLGIQDEPTVEPSLKAGVDVLAFSGDKLLGGPQAGILIGRREPLLKIRRNPLFRALRVDKLTIAALEATVAIYLKGDLNEIPTLRMIRISAEDLARRAARLAELIATQPGMKAQVEQGESVVGGGSTPGQSLPTSLVCVSHPKLSAQALESELRKNDPPIIVRIERDLLVLDLRTVLADQEEKIVEALRRIAGKFGDAAGSGGF
ncbi:MAG TPA: L-seryl-tRNA(Sec) selenium transferase [Terriglobia bacterium]|nr:L-seryl-tRNA(Sec) selenium transferase [Terriglobia bacterium]